MKFLNYKINDSIDFKVYFDKIYGSENYKEFTKNILKPLDSKMDELELLFKLEANRWSFILNVPVAREILKSRLDQKQFYSFIYLNEIEAVRLNDAKFIFDFYDLNHDSVIDFDEFNEGIKSKFFLVFFENRKGGDPY